MVLRVPIGSWMPDKRIKLPKTIRQGALFTLKIKTMSKSKTKSEKVKRISQLTVINPTVAGIDVSDTEMMVAYPINSGQLEIQVFGCYTRDLHLIANCLKAKGVTTIAMESTGVYWVTLFLYYRNMALKFIWSMQSM